MNHLKLTLPERSLRIYAKGRKDDLWPIQMIQQLASPCAQSSIQPFSASHLNIHRQILLDLSKKSL